MMKSKAYDTDNTEKQQAEIALILQKQIAARAERELITHKADRMSLMMDLASVDLDLGRLLAAPLFDFAHDIHGIRRHMDRSTYPGKLKDCFVPRFSRHQNEK